MRNNFLKLSYAIALVSVVYFVSAEPGPTPNMALTEAISGSPMAEEIRFEYAIYYLPAPRSNPVTLLTDLLKTYPEMKLVTKPSRSFSGMQVSQRFIKDVQSKYAPPDMKSLSYFGRGISREQMEKLQGSQQALILDFAHPRSKVFDALQIANKIVAQLAQQSNGLIWDEESREIFSVDEWRSRRVLNWTQGAPDVSKHTVIHAYKKQEYARAITLGMAKFGLPDVVVEEFSWSLNTSIGNLINAFAQTMVEGAIFTKQGEYDLKLNAIQNTAMREANVLTLKKNAESTARLSFKNGTNEDGDPQNRLIEITFNRYPGPDNHAKQEKLIGSLWGSEDSVVSVKHNNELEATSKRARAKLPALQHAFTLGLAPGEFIQVKAPFEVPTGGREWMWVEIIEWKSGRIKGLLKNEPASIPKLHGGQIVEVREQDVFDYIRRFANGKQEGNETGDIIQRMSKRGGH
jgi:uncharacterized protein YegJ (DUF2314 family)